MRSVAADRAPISGPGSAPTTEPWAVPRNSPGGQWLALAAIVVISVWPGFVEGKAREGTAGFIKNVQAAMRDSDGAFERLEQVLLNAPAPSSVLPLARMVKVSCNRATARLEQMGDAEGFPQKVQAGLMRWTTQLGWVARYRAEIALSANFFAVENDIMHLRTVENFARSDPDSKSAR